MRIWCVAAPRLPFSKLRMLVGGGRLMGASRGGKDFDEIWRIPRIVSRRQNS
jgi:hypothetical protein